MTFTDEHRKLADSIFVQLQNYHPDEAYQLVADFERRAQLEAFTHVQGYIINAQLKDAGFHGYLQDNIAALSAPGGVEK